MYRHICYVHNYPNSLFLLHPFDPFILINSDQSEIIKRKLLPYAYFTALILRFRILSNRNPNISHKQNNQRKKKSIVYLNKKPT